MNPLNHPAEWASARASLIKRRWFLRDCGVGLAGIALNSLLSREATACFSSSKPQGPHFPAKAKRVIYMFQAGAPSHLELFDQA